ncbi:MAG: hypothetical protein AB1457_18370 [Chloroflexota bacterium]|jgi:hypothetical protein|nr:MAG: hypothetical protein KatS3mg046_503 [Bellilinea sp.]
MRKEKGEYRPAIQPIPPADEQVAEILSTGQRRFDEQRLSREERAAVLRLREKAEEKKRKEKERALAREKNRITTYLPTSLIKDIHEIADQEHVSMAQVITFFLFEAVEKYRQKEIGFWGYKHPSESPRYGFVLVHPKDTERTEKIESRKNEKSW